MRVNLAKKRIEERCSSPLSVKEVISYSTIEFKIEIQIAEWEFDYATILQGG